MGYHMNTGEYHVINLYGNGFHQYLLVSLRLVFISDEITSIMEPALKWNKLSSVNDRSTW